MDGLPCLLGEAEALDAGVHLLNDERRPVPHVHQRDNHRRLVQRFDAALPAALRAQSLLRARLEVPEREHEPGAHRAPNEVEQPVDVLRAVEGARGGAHG